MKVAKGTATAREVKGAMLGGTSVKAIMHGYEQVFPDVSSRVKQVRLDMAPLTNTEEGRVFDYLLARVAAAGQTPSLYLRVQAGGEDYCVNGVYGDYLRVQYQDGVLYFGDGAPLKSALKPGDKVTLVMGATTTETESFGVATTKEVYPWYDGAYLNATADKYRIDNNSDYVTINMRTSKEEVIFSGSLHIDDNAISDGN